jgi:hypothetical protein
MQMPATFAAGIVGAAGEDPPGGDKLETATPGIWTPEPDDGTAGAVGNPSDGLAVASLGGLVPLTGRTGMAIASVSGVATEGNGDGAF